MEKAVPFFLVGLLTIGIASFRYGHAQRPGAQDEDIVRVSTSLVTVPVSVKSRDSGFITTLRQEDFRIYEDGTEQRIAHFETADQPFTVVLALDTSDSARIELKDIQNAAIAFVKQLKSNDRAQIVAFDANIRVLCEPTSNQQALSQTIRQVKTGGGTSLYEALDMLLTLDRKRRVGRAAIVVLTDGIDTSSVSATYESTLAKAGGQYALVYPVQYNSVADLPLKKVPPNGGFGPVYTTARGEPITKAFERGTRYLRMMAGVSGGRFQYAASLTDLEHSFARIAEELRQQYSIGYYPLDRLKKGKRRIKVTVNQGDIIHARGSYIYTLDDR